MIIYGDAAFVGARITEICQNNSVNLISQPKKKRNGEMTHTLTVGEALQLKNNRSYIEHLNSDIKRAYGVRTKSVKTIKVYRTLLFVRLLCLGCKAKFIG